MDLIKLNTSQLLLTSLLAVSNSEMGNFYERETISLNGKRIFVLSGTHCVMENIFVEGSDWDLDKDRYHVMLAQVILDCDWSTHAQYSPLIGCRAAWTRRPAT